AMRPDTADAASSHRCARGDRSRRRAGRARAARGGASQRVCPASLRTMQEQGWEQRALFRRWPAGVSVVVAEVDGRRAGLTVSSLVSLSLDPPLVGISIALQASLHELLREAGEWGASLLGGDQDRIAQHFSRSVPPIAQWDGIVMRPDPRLLVDAVGWIVARNVEELRTGDHTFFVAEIVSLAHGPA